MHDLRSARLWLCLLLTTCAADDEPSLLHAEIDVPAEGASASLSTMQPVADPAPAVVDEWDPYASWKHWCEPTTYDRVCKQHSDCADLEHVSRRPLRCFHTKQAKRDGLRDENGDPLKFCAPGQTGPVELEWRRARLRDLVGQLYFDEDTRCPEWSWDLRGKGRNARFVQQWANGKPLHQQHYRCQREWKAAEHLAAFLWVPYLRETTARPWARHRLNADQHANEQAWVKEAGTYGWVVELTCSNGKRRCKNDRLVVANYYPDPEADDHTSNPHYGDRYRWQFGLGGFGKNTGYGVQDWDRQAPPEILCLEVPNVETYLRDARRAVDVYRGSGVVCDGAVYKGRAVRHVDDGVGGVRLDIVAEPSWADVHRVASGGKFCPRTDATGQRYETLFQKRMQAQGLRADEPVTRGMLGRAIPRDVQNERAFGVMARLEQVLPPPWDVPRGAAFSADSAAP